MQSTRLGLRACPLTAFALKRNVDLNGLTERVTIHNVALGNKDGEVKFTRGLDTVNRVATPDEGNTQTVRVRRLDTLIGSHQPTMITIDVEGYEDEVIRGAKDVLRDDSLKVVEIETVTPEIDEAFNRNHFERAYYDPFARRLTRSASGFAASRAGPDLIESKRILRLGIL